ncbi:MAG: carbamate kinase, partial [Sphaerochaetaceae bacterium]|nr:carbamate kinase [Sphaerochaetaceae bacterium]
GLKTEVSTVVTLVEVDPNDPSFTKPTKPIGSFMTEEEAKTRVEQNGWNVAEDAGRGWRRVVASPKPKAIIELESIKKLTDSGATVIAAGGGGIPVIRQEDGSLTGSEAVIDKDLAAALMAKELKADVFVISTAVEKVCINYKKPNEEALDKINIARAKSLMEEGHFAPGSMLPKVQAMVDFVASTGHIGIITDPEHLYDSLYGNSGTKIIP